MKVRIKFRKYGALRFIGHLDVMRFFQKVMRRAEIPIAFSGGYSPHMIMSFANPLGIGLSSDGEYFDVELQESIASAEAVRRMNEVCVEGIEVLSFRQIAEEKKMTGMAIYAAADYQVNVPEKTLLDEMQTRLQDFLDQTEITILKQTKRSEREVDIRPMIYEMRIMPTGIFIQTAAGSVENLKPQLVMEAFCRFLGKEFEQKEFSYTRTEMYADIGEGNTHTFVPLEDLGTEIEG